MHPRFHAETSPDAPAAILADSGAMLTYGELETRANQGAQYFRRLGLKPGQTIAIWFANVLEYYEVYWAAQRAGLYITPVSTKLTAEEAAYILNDSDTQLLVASGDIRPLSELRGMAAKAVPHLQTILTVGLSADGLDDWRTTISVFPATPITDETAGFHMVYSSGTTGRPKGIRLPLTGGPATEPHMLAQQQEARYGTGPHSVYLSPAPLYHTAPLAFTTSVHRLGGTVIILPKFTPEAALEAIQRYRVTITQMVPTMFLRMLRLPDAQRLSYDVSSLQYVIHAAAPCPIATKEAMIDWLGPIIYEYYGGSEGNGSTFITPEEWLEKKGSVGKATWGILHICNEDGRELPAGEQGIIYFEGGWDFKYLNDEEKTRDSRHPEHPGWSALGDVGYMDEDGYLFLTDRKSFMIISGGVNVYPQEAENLLIVHPKVADVAVVGVPSSEMGEEVKAVVQPREWNDAGPELEAELIAYCREHLSAIKCPRSIDFDPELPRHETGKLYKRGIRDRYWVGHQTRIA